MNCLTEKTIKRYLACDVSREEFAEISEHLASCEKCREAVRRMSSVSLETFAMGADICPDYEELSRYVDGEKMSPEFMSHIRSCELCARDIEAIRKIRLLKPEKARLTWQRYVWIPAAAAAALAVFLIGHSPQTVPGPDKPAVMAILPGADTNPQTLAEKIPDETKPTDAATPKDEAPKPPDEVKAEDPKEPEPEKKNDTLAQAQKNAADEVKKEIKNEENKVKENVYNENGVNENKETRLAAAVKEEKNEEPEEAVSEKTFDPVEVAAAPSVRLRGGEDKTVEKKAEEPAEKVAANSVETASAGNAMKSVPRISEPLAKGVRPAPTKLTWSKVEGADSYRAEIFTTDGNKVEEAITKGTSYTPTKLESGKTYTVKYSYRANETDPWHVSERKKIIAK